MEQTKSIHELCYELGLPTINEFKENMSSLKDKYKDASTITLREVVEALNSVGVFKPFFQTVIPIGILVTSTEVISMLNIRALTLK